MIDDHPDVTDGTRLDIHSRSIGQFVEFAERQLRINQLLLDRLTVVEEQLAMLIERHGL